MKICLIASSGGHYEQVMKLKPLIEKYSGFIITEKTQYKTEAKYLLPQINRREKLLVFKLINITIKSLIIFLREKPDLVISTGALSCIPTCIISKIFKKKVIFIESFAKVDSPTQTGKLIHKFADLFLIQWINLQKVYPNAVFKGGIY